MDVTYSIANESFRVEHSSPTHVCISIRLFNGNFFRNYCDIDNTLDTSGFICCGYTVNVLPLWCTQIDVCMYSEISIDAFLDMTFRFKKYILDELQLP